MRPPRPGGERGRLQRRLPSPRKPTAEQGAKRRELNGAAEARRAEEQAAVQAALAAQAGESQEAKQRELNVAAEARRAEEHAAMQASLAAQAGAEQGAKQRELQAAAEVQLAGGQTAE